jgi:hypothetical protein
MAKTHKNGKDHEPFKLGARGYSDPPKNIEEAMKDGPVIQSVIPEDTTFELKRPSPVEGRKMHRAWQRYRIKDHERGHRAPLSKTLKISTRRFNTCTTLPENVYAWVKRKRNRADYLRNLLMKEYWKASVR